MDIHLTEHDCFLLDRARDARDQHETDVCVLAVRTFQERECPGHSLKGAAAKLLHALFGSRSRSMRLEKYILRKAKEHGFESEAEDVLYGDVI